jgi:hypothetical protein
VDNVSDWLTNRVTDHVVEQFGDSTYSITISQEQEDVIAKIADSWFWDCVGNTLEANDLVAVMLTGIHAGSAISLADCSELGLIFPLKRVTNL